MLLGPQLQKMEILFQIDLEISWTALGKYFNAPFSKQHTSNGSFVATIYSSPPPPISWPLFSKKKWCGSELWDHTEHRQFPHEWKGMHWVCSKLMFTSSCKVMNEYLIERHCTNVHPWPCHLQWALTSWPMFSLVSLWSRLHLNPHEAVQRMADWTVLYLRPQQIKIPSATTL